MTTSFPNPSAVARTAATYGRDLAERIVTSFIGGFTAGVVVTQPLDGSMWYSALAGGVVAVVSLVKGLVARAVGDPNSASLTKS
ncbi:hypothetical protein AB0M28_13390 [Streptomyces sp. NPDC051940]|uniref:hypothetical protein n=1 Tax=Streptomyces sp. NPDC051940 TaxID=3155675 RepID=UPI0034136E18